MHIPNNIRYRQNFKARGQLVLESLEEDSSEKAVNQYLSTSCNPAAEKGWRTKPLQKDLSFLVQYIEPTMTWRAQQYVSIHFSEIIFLSMSLMSQKLTQTLYSRSIPFHVSAVWTG